MALIEIKQTTVVEQVMKKIKELIASGRFQVDSRIPTENELAIMFDIGRSSIREAIKIFNYLGILKSLPGKGTFLCDRTNISTELLTWSILLGTNEIYEFIELRHLLEQRGITTLTEKYKIDPGSISEDLTKLANMIDNMKDAIKRSSLNETVQADYGFHNIIIEGSRISLFASIFRTLESFMHEEIKKTNRAVYRKIDVVKEHESIINAIRTGNTALAVNAVDLHIDNVKKRLKKQMNIEHQRNQI